MSSQALSTAGLAAGRHRRLIVVGSGIAGLYAALLAADAGASVVLLTKGELEHSNTWYAQGGISAVLDGPAAGDTVAAHINDTLQAGAGHCNPEAVRVMCTEARHDIAGLQRYGVHFDVGSAGGPALGLEAAHSAPRILHAGGDATGAKVTAALIRSVLSRHAAGVLAVIAGAHATSLLHDGGTVTGVEFLQEGSRGAVHGDAVLLATGGAGQLFAQTTNPAVATADGIALAVRAGAEVADLEFFQFHPTCLAQAANPSLAGLTVEPLLISEAVRGEGAVLVDGNGKRFMAAYHRDAELAPRDVVSRSIALHLAKLGDPNGHVYLDARVIEDAKGKGFLQKRFPTLTQRTLEAGIDWTRELVPVAPAAHYWMGGVRTDLHARTTVPGLYAAGKWRAPGFKGQTGWPATPSSKDSCSAAALSSTSWEAAPQIPLRLRSRLAPATASQARRPVRPLTRQRRFRDLRNCRMIPTRNSLSPLRWKPIQFFSPSNAPPLNPSRSPAMLSAF